MRVAVINDYMGATSRMADWTSLGPSVQVDWFDDHVADEAVLAERLAGHDVVVTERDRTRFSRSLLERLPRLKLLVATGPVNWAIDFDATRERNVTVCYTDSEMGAAPELAWGLLLSLTRRIPWDDANIRRGGWQTSPGIGLAGRTLGVLGLGYMGQTLARYATAFGMDTLAWSQNLTDEAARSAGARRVALETLLREADVVAVCLVLSERTRGLLGRDRLALMKPGSYLLNTARGPIVNEADLIEALRARRIAGAGLDVYDTEPLPPDHPFRTLDNLVLTPHTGYITESQHRLFYGQVVENIAAYRRGAPVRVMTGPYMIPTARPS